MKGRVLVVAGSDSGAGAGIQADIKTVTMLGGYATTAITAVTVQDTSRVHDIFILPPELVAAQMQVVLDDIGADAIKIGMLGTAPVVDAIADVIDRLPVSLPLVIDPVMMSKGGTHLLDYEAAAALKRRLLVRADLITPNTHEAEALTGLAIRDLSTMRHAAEMLHTFGCRAVLMKGGHLDGSTVVDILFSEDGEEEFVSPRLSTPHTHGTGCTLASAVATGLAQGMSLRDAVLRGRDFVHQAILNAPGLGRGHGPLGHDYLLQSDKTELSTQRSVRV